MPWNNRETLNRSLSACRIHTSNPACWLSFQGDKGFFNISRRQDEGRGGCFSSRVYCCLKFHNLWVMALMSNVSFIAGLRIALVVICGDLGKATCKVLQCRKSWTWFFASSWQGVKRAFCFAAVVVLTPLEYQSQASQSLVLLLLVCSEAKRGTRKTLLPAQLGLYSGILLTKFYIRAKQCL